MKIANGIEALVGGTPTVALDRLVARLGLGARLFAKLEGQNPAGSAKDRVALSMLLDAEARGVLKPGGTVIEPTSGNTGIGLCALSAARGYRAIIVMPDSMSVERRRLMRAYGAELVLTPGSEGMAGAIRRAQELREEIPGAFIPDQFENPENPAAHYKTTGPELYADMDGAITAFVAGVGTGGTVTGIGRYLKERNAAIRVYGVEPAARHPGDRRGLCAEDAGCIGARRGDHRHRRRGSRHRPPACRDRGHPCRHLGGCRPCRRHPPCGKARAFGGAHRAPPARHG